ncbi:C-type lectin 37Db isoform X2 [Drosophila serrata]|uniref:C-type lectin 37Db isoform X2 n=2 Tax=Drosophila serrata TaxID=7274 RepID=UPI000A1D09C3|nr:C-type lectin 37Db isoform X2 [Drosophila serrata]
MSRVLLVCLLLWSVIILEAAPLQNKVNIMISGKNYYISSSKCNWFEASNRCRQMGGFLLNLESKEELKFLTPYLHPALSYWISTNDLGVRHFYVSEATGIEAPFLDWSVGQPDNIEGNERCVELWPSTSSFQMNDLSCQRLVGFICQVN